MKFLIVAGILGFLVFLTYKYVLYIAIVIYIALFLWIGSFMRVFDKDKDDEQDSDV